MATVIFYAISLKTLVSVVHVYTYVCVCGYSVLFDVCLSYIIIEVIQNLSNLHLCVISRSSIYERYIKSVDN